MGVSRRRLGLTDLARRITGFSTPFFGVQWTPLAAERDMVRGFLTFLEDRRVLFVPHHLEVHGEVERSVHEIGVNALKAWQHSPSSRGHLAPFGLSARHVVASSMSRVKIFETSTRVTSRISETAQGFSPRWGSCARLSALRLPFWLCSTKLSLSPSWP